jgi:hypothetical protein
LPSLVVACSVFQETQRSLTESEAKSTNWSGYCFNSGSQSTSTASMSLRPDPAASRVFRLSRASLAVAAFLCSTLTLGLAFMYSAISSS